ncbi:MAG: sulfatase [Sandaracinaceae bacterium]
MRADDRTERAARASGRDELRVDDPSRSGPLARGSRGATIALILALGGLALSCGDDDDDGDDTTVTETPGSEDTHEATSDEESTRAREQLGEMRMHFDLLATAHLADIDHHGLYIDFGTPARMHYTMGRWHSGFLRDVAAGERDFTRIGTDARAWFHVDEAGPLTMRFRGRPLASRAVVVYLNGQRVGQIDFTRDGVQDVDVRVPASRVSAGENALMLRAAETQPIQGEDVAAELDSLWIFRGTAPTGELHPPLYTELVHDVTVGGQARPSVALRAPTTIRWYADVPADGRLSLGFGAPAGSAQIAIRVTPEGGQPRELLAASPVPTDAWADRMYDLSELAGEIVRIEVAVTGEAETVGLSGPAIVVPRPREALASAQARSAIVLLIDTMRADKLRVYNPRSRVQTPMLDEFGGEAAVFENAQAPENWTKPSVASVLTSLTPMTHNTKEQSSSLPASALTIAEVFQRNEFATASFIANGYVSDRFGFNQGWDHYTNYIREERNTEAGNVFREAIGWIEEHRQDRFFVYIQTIDPHVPYDPPEDILRLYDAAAYDGPLRPRSTGLQLEDVKNNRMTLTPRDIQHLEALHDGEVTYHDRELTRFIARLRELGLYDEVVFVVTSDHGEEFNDHGSFGHGHSIFQELLHVPLMVRWHDVIPPSRFAPTVTTLDVAPTVLEATGIEIPDEFEGHSLLSTARGVTRPGPAIAFSDKLDDRRVAVAAGYKLVIRNNLTWAFFNLRTDPGEHEQLDDGGRHPIALRYLRGMYGQHLGADDRGDWLHAGTGGASRTLPRAESQIDAEMCRQLRALGYIDARCNDLL